MNETIYLSKGSGIMKIINPLYDNGFKYLMDNPRYARKFLSAVLDADVEQAALCNQVNIYPDENCGLVFLRLDFNVKVKQDQGIVKDVMVIIQKSKLSSDHRAHNGFGCDLFRNHRQNNREQSVIPASDAINVYLLGYNLDDLPYMSISVNQNIVVPDNGVYTKSYSIENIAPIHIIQVRRLPDSRRTRLEKMMMFFNQAWCTHNRYVLDLQEVPAGYQDVAEYLHVPLMDQQFTRTLELEEEMESFFDKQQTRFLRQMVELENTKLEEQRRLDLILLRTAGELKKSQIPVKKIMEITGLSYAQIGNL
jgi:hypothetical protein